MSVGKNWVSFRVEREPTVGADTPLPRAHSRLGIRGKINDSRGRSEGAARTRPGCCANPGSSESVRAVALQRDAARTWEAEVKEEEEERRSEKEKRVARVKCNGLVQK